MNSQLAALSDALHGVDHHHDCTNNEHHDCTNDDHHLDCTNDDHHDYFEKG